MHIMSFVSSIYIYSQSQLFDFIYDTPNRRSVYKIIIKELSF